MLYNKLFIYLSGLMIFPSSDFIARAQILVMVSNSRVRAARARQVFMEVESAR